MSNKSSNHVTSNESKEIQNENISCKNTQEVVLTEMMEFDEIANQYVDYNEVRNVCISPPLFTPESDEEIIEPTIKRKKLCSQPEYQNIADKLDQPSQSKIEDSQMSEELKPYQEGQLNVTEDIDHSISSNFKCDIDKLSTMSTTNPDMMTEFRDLSKFGTDEYINQLYQMNVDDLILKHNELTVTVDDLFMDVQKMTYVLIDSRRNSIMI